MENFQSSLEVCIYPDKRVHAWNNWNNSSCRGVECSKLNQLEFCTWYISRMWGRTPWQHWDTPMILVLWMKTKDKGKCTSSHLTQEVRVVKINGSFAALVCTHCVLVCGCRGQLRVLRRGRGYGGQQHSHPRQPRQPRQPQPRHRWHPPPPRRARHPNLAWK